MLSIIKVLEFFIRIPFIARFVNRLATNLLAKATSARPHSYSLWSPLGKAGQDVPPSHYLSWHTVTDKNYFDLHLPPASEAYIHSLPSNEKNDQFPMGEISYLFRRKGAMQSDRSSVFFMFFAQWFTDGFFRSSHYDARKTTSNHNIDLAQIYGAKESTEVMLRAGQGGKLRSQMIDGEEYPDALGEFDSNGHWKVKDCYQDLPYVKDTEWMTNIFGDLNKLTDEQKANLYATGLERGNPIVGHMVMSTLFLREHNNICDGLAAQYPDWDDDRLFHTARIINTVILMKLVIEDYVNHIAGLKVLKMDPSFVEKQPWYRAPWIAAEFNLLYRWHGLVPDAFNVSGKPESLVRNYTLLRNHGLSTLLEAATQQVAGKISVDNVPHFLMTAEREMIEKGREWRLQSFNDYREKFGLSRLTSFDQLTENTELRDNLKRLYSNIDQLELTVGLFAEEGSRTLTGELQTAMVAYDAITQIYTNPLLAKANFTEAHFTPFGMARIEVTKSFQDLVDRNTQRKVTVAVKYPSN